MSSDPDHEYLVDGNDSPGAAASLVFNRSPRGFYLTSAVLVDLGDEEEGYFPVRRLGWVVSAPLRGFLPSFLHLLELFFYFILFFRINKLTDKEQRTALGT